MSRNYYLAAKNSAFLITYNISVSRDSFILPFPISSRHCETIFVMIYLLSAERPISDLSQKVKYFIFSNQDTRLL